MASALALWNHPGIRRMDLGPGHVGLGGVVMTTAVGAGASYGLGQVYARYRDKWYGKHAPTMAAVLGKVAAVGLSLFRGGGAHWASGAFNAIGQAGVDAKALQLGIEHGMKSMKKSVIVVPELAKDAKLPEGQQQLIGELAAAAAGKGLSFDQIEELASMH